MIYLLLLLLRLSILLGIFFFGIYQDASINFFIVFFEPNQFQN